MGLLGGAFRVASYTARTGVRAGRSVASGRVPSLSIGLGLGGFGARIGTRGVSIRTPIASQSIGAHGLTSTIRLPGIASLSVNPIRPAVTAGLGPFRLRAGKNPSIRIGTPLLSLGFSTHPLLTANIGPISLNIPGLLTSPSRPWSEEIDDQWRPHFERRPPSISEQLHQLINNVESAAKTPISHIALNFNCPQVPLEPVTRRDRRAAKRSIHKDVMQNIKFFHLKRRKEGRLKIRGLLAEWEAAESTLRVRNQAELQYRVDRAHRDWIAGDIFLSTLVFQAICHALGFPAYVFSVDNSKVRVAVFSPTIDDIHPQGPSWTPSGNPTVKKRTKKERQDIWVEICGTQITSVGRIGESSYRKPIDMEIFTVLPSRVTNFGDLPTVSKARLPINQVGTASGGRAFRDGILVRPQKMSTMDKSLKGTDSSIMAIGFSVTSTSDIAAPAFWLQADALREEVTRSGIQSRPSLKNAPVPDSQESSTINTDLEDLAEQVRQLSTPEIVVDEDFLEPLVSSFEVLPRNVIDRELAEELLIELAAHAAMLVNLDLLLRIEQLAKSFSVNQEIISEIHSYMLSGQIGEFESELTTALAQLRMAVDECRLKNIVECSTRLVAQLPHVPLGADDEAEDLGWVLVEFLAILGRHDLLATIVTAVAQSSYAIQTRFQKINNHGSDAFRITHLIISQIKQNPGCVQSQLPEILSLDKSRVRKICWYLAHFGFIDRHQHGQSYRLWISEDQTWPLAP